RAFRAHRARDVRALFPVAADRRGHRPLRRHHVDAQPEHAGHARSLRSHDRRQRRRRLKGSSMSEQGREKYVYAFEEGGRDQKYLLGGKGANLAEMTNLGLPVPPGFTISTDACKAYMALGDEMPAGLMAEVAVAREQLEQKMGKLLGDADDPLLVSVRSGAPFSMPGMMDTVLNLGLNDESVKGLAKQTQNERFAYDSYRRFVQMFGKIVLDVSGELFAEALHELVEKRGVSVDTDLTAEDLAGLVETFKAIVRSEKGLEFPTD